MESHLTEHLTETIEQVKNPSWSEPAKPDGPTVVPQEKVLFWV